MDDAPCCNNESGQEECWHLQIGVSCRHFAPIVTLAHQDDTLSLSALEQIVSTVSLEAHHFVSHI